MEGHVSQDSTACGSLLAAPQEYLRAQTTASTLGSQLQSTPLLSTPFADVDEEHEMLDPGSTFAADKPNFEMLQVFLSLYDPGHIS
ncbi:hypothetical protein PC116_g19203 [Phytophthora cactorum]|uniref:Uncharacterized protein n=1 Tax=Phytophthora cactorum TaxID=29920 RepID=A0A8T1KA11_9STRA|nr:hypothetical protein Pcac1_g3187 [Phytophthora cactorum]KAG2895362.1 hypothetical protein PC114_g15503 [Phytophthora cactorum]KAG2926662.1 hypothetical protein PC117_g14805 [Phytophthora cactorum]KAG3003389.1 hypothetical protein PC119_g16024 [Phytophthora cactorum]KAG3149368.1 hypothetical protein C6341_g17074 [Phytophthora cactorum]